MLISKVDHMVITATNPARVAEFYGKLGFTAKEGNSRLELFCNDFKINVHSKGAELKPCAFVPTPGSGDFCFEVTGSIDEIVEELTENDVNIELGPVTRQCFKGVAQSVYLRDTEGNLVELTCYE